MKPRAIVLALVGIALMMPGAPRATASEPATPAPQEPAFTIEQVVRSGLGLQWSEFENHPTEFQLGGVAYEDRAVDRFSIDRGTVGRPEILDRDALIGARESGVVAGNRRVAHPEIAAGGRADGMHPAPEAEVIGGASRHAAQMPGVIQSRKSSRSPNGPDLNCAAITEKAATFKSADSMSVSLAGQGHSNRTSERCVLEKWETMTWRKRVGECARTCVSLLKLTGMWFNSPSEHIFSAGSISCKLGV